MTKKLRADQLLFQSGQADSREQARRLIMAGLVFMPAGRGEQRINKPGTPLPADCVLRLAKRQAFVSRGAEKLLTAIEHFKLDFKEKICLDVGASTGGFTDCMLQYGAKKVYAVDVGYGQLHARLRNDHRVINLEKINIRYIKPELIPEPVNFICADVSFISLTKVIPACLQFCECVFLIKPQFEVGPGLAIRGVVRDKSLQQKTVDQIVDFMVTRCRLNFCGTVPARIKGPKGNQEYLALFNYTA